MTRIVVFTVQCKSIEPANTNIRNATHTPGSARSNIAERTTPHNAKACRQMEASNNADSATLSMKNKTKQLRQLAHMYTRVLVLVLVQGQVQRQGQGKFCIRFAPRHGPWPGRGLPFGHPGHHKIHSNFDFQLKKIWFDNEKWKIQILIGFCAKNASISC